MHIKYAFFTVKMAQQWLTRTGGQIFMWRPSYIFWGYAEKKVLRKTDAQNLAFNRGKLTLSQLCSTPGSETLVFVKIKDQPGLTRLETQGCAIQ